MDEKSHVNPIINNQVRYVTLIIILLLYQGIQYAILLLLENITLLGKHISRFIMCNDRHSVLLVKENIARSPTEEQKDLFGSHVAGGR